MKCPVCNVNLTMAERRGVEIDYCPQCRGVWLDRGELDKIIENASFQGQPEERYSQHPRESGTHKKPKRKSFLGELFDFD
ncbi:MAG: zf-TFIIB domain-containing protein [Bacillota bacterium]